MKKLGIIGGIGPEATVNYYLDIIKGYQKRIGTDKQLPEILINSINMYDMFDMLDQGEYQLVADYLSQAANQLKQSGADFGLMCGNTPHIVFSTIQNQSKLPLLSIVQTSLDRAKALGLHKLGLLGTKFTMQNHFFSQPFINAGIQISLPDSQSQAFIHQKIVDELENGIVKGETKKQLLKIINAMIQEKDLDGIILGCTELPLIINKTDLSVVILDIAQIHIESAIDQILS
ncbi:MAG: amino acid racemase [Lentilactobacillus diolivorans]|jgi:aspartate racemase|nr:amino acid racemase [Lentilactobacillus diolivorans]RRG01716.1 MAG: amino acid racemase [Lactobacillus sp.]